MESLDILEPGTPLCASSVLTLLQRVAKILNSLKGTGGITLTKDDDNSWNISPAGATGGNSGGSSGSGEEIDVVVGVSVTSDTPPRIEVKKKKVTVLTQKDITSDYISFIDVDVVTDATRDLLNYGQIQFNLNKRRVSVLRSVSATAQNFDATPNMIEIDVDGKLAWNDQTPALTKDARKIRIPSGWSSSYSPNINILNGCIFWEAES